MRKIFQEYGGVVVVVIAVVALIGLVSLLMQPNGVMHQAFGDITQAFVDKSDELIGGELNGGAGGSGGSGGAGGSESGEPIAYLYNGVQLPDINEVWTDKETYPYAFIYAESSGIYSFYAGTEAVVVNSGYVRTQNSCAFLYSLTTDTSNTSWNAVSTHADNANANKGLAVQLLWTSFGILNSDGTVYLAASEPVPVYE